MAFAHPYWLLALLGLPLLVGWVWWAHVIRQRRFARFAEARFRPTLARSVSPTRRMARAILRVAVVGLLIIAAARPQWGAKERVIVREGSDIVLCLDVSTSMLARDIQPNRLARAKEQIKTLIRQLQGDRVGLVVFAGQAYVQCPLTLDYGLAIDLVDIVGTHSVSAQGTRLGDAIRTAQKAFGRAAMGTKAVILVTDGEDQESAPLEAAEDAAKEGIVIECVGIGSMQGVPIQLEDGSYKTDEQGYKVMSRLDAQTLREIAKATRGTAVVTGETGDMDLGAIYQRIKGYEKREIESMNVRLLEDRFQWPLGLALVLLGIELCLGDRIRERNQKKSASIGARRISRAQT